MAASRKPPNADPAVLASMRGKRVAVGLSGGVDSVVLLHLLHSLAPAYRYRLSAIHVNHGLSPNAGSWQKFCSALCRDLGIRFKAAKVKVQKHGRGLEAAAREARRAAFAKLDADAIALGHHLDDQAETVLHNLLRGAGLEGAGGMAPVGRLGGKQLLRPLLGVSRASVLAYARSHRLHWIEDESNADEALTRNFMRHRVGPLLAKKFPRWRENLARAARHFASEGLDQKKLLRAFLKDRGLRAPSEAKLVEMLRQLGSSSAAISHDGVLFRRYRDRVFPLKETGRLPAFKPQTWSGEARLALPQLGGELRFRCARGRGIASELIKGRPLQVRLRSGGERLRLDARRPSRTLKNLFQEAGIPPWERGRLPLLFCGDELVWVPKLGVDAAFASKGVSRGIEPMWMPAVPRAPARFRARPRLAPR